MVVISIASTDLMSGTHTSRFIGPFLRWLSPGISADAIATIQLLIRKAAHVAEYAVFAAVLVRAVRGHCQTPVWQIGIVITVASVYAALDETHQSFVASRTGSPRDVMIDICGAIAGLMISRIFFAKQRRRRTISAGT